MRKKGGGSGSVKVEEKPREKCCEIEICPATCWLFGEEFEELAVGASGREANLTGTALWVVGVAMVSPGLIGMKIQ